MSRSSVRGNVASDTGRRLVRVAVVLGVLAALIAAAVILAPPAVERWREQHEIRELIRRYNELLADGYRSLNMEGMREVAVQLQAEDEYIHMSSLAEGGVRLDPELIDIEFVAVSVETTTAQVETRETWNYRHYSRIDGTLLLIQEGMVYHLAWDLERQPDDRWLVADVRAISSTSTVEPEELSTSTPAPRGE